MKSTYIWGESWYRNVSKKMWIDMLPEMRKITDENIVIQIENARVYWSINSLKFYKEKKE